MRITATLRILANSVADRPTALLSRLAGDANALLNPDDRVRAQACIAGAPFNPEVRPVSEWQRIGMDVTGRPHPSKPGETLTPSTELTSVEWHAVKHTATGEWQEGTTTAEYLDDIRCAARHPDAVLHVGREWIPVGGRGRRLASRAAMWTDIAKPAFKKVVRKVGHAFLTIYDPVRGCICSGYHTASAKAAAKFAQWENHRAFGRDA